MNANFYEVKHNNRIFFVVWIFLVSTWLVITQRSDFFAPLTWWNLTCAPLKPYPSEVLEHFLLKTSSHLFHREEVPPPSPSPPPPCPLLSDTQMRELFKGHLSEIAIKLWMQGRRGAGFFFPSLQMQTLPPIVILWPLQRAHQLKRWHSNAWTNHRFCVFQSAAAAPSPVMGNMPPNDAMPGGPMPPGFFQVRPSAPPHLSAALPLHCSLLHTSISCEHLHT